MNTSPTRANYADSGVDGYEYIPDDFVPVNLTPGLKSVYRVLFGENADGLFKGLRVKELLAYIHETELADYIYKLDPRVTYWPAQINDKTLLERKKILITQTRGNPRRLIVTGELTAAEHTGVSYRSYLVALGVGFDSPVPRVYAKQLEPPYGSVFTDFTPPESTTIRLPNSTLDARVLETTLYGDQDNIQTELGGNIIAEVFTQIGVGKLLLETPINFSLDNLQEIIAQWYVITRAAPEPAIVTAMPVLETIGEVAFIELFGLNNEEPYRTFKNLWETHPLGTYRLAGLTLALIYRLNELRRKNGN